MRHGIFGSIILTVLHLSSLGFVTEDDANLISHPGFEHAPDPRAYGSCFRQIGTLTA